MKLRQKSLDQLKDLDLTKYTKNGTLRRRKQKTSRDYFNQDTEDAIISYTKLASSSAKSRLFSERINYSFYKLAENVINTYKLHAEDEDPKDVEQEVVCFLIEQMSKYDQNFGKAYSYFGTIAKRFLIQRKIKMDKIKNRRRDMDLVDESVRVLRITQEEDFDKDVSHFVKSYIAFLENSIDDIHENRYYKQDNVTKRQILVKEYITFTEKDKVIVNTILGLFKIADELEVFYKPALYLQIRETTGQKTTDITRVIKIMKCIMEQQANIYYHKGALDIEEDDTYAYL